MENLTIFVQYLVKLKLKRKNPKMTHFHNFLPIFVNFFLKFSNDLTCLSRPDSCKAFYGGEQSQEKGNDERCFRGSAKWHLQGRFDKWHKLIIVTTCILAFWFDRARDYNKVSYSFPVSAIWHFSGQILYPSIRISIRSSAHCELARTSGKFKTNSPQVAYF